MITVLREELPDIFRNKEWPLFDEETAQDVPGYVPNLSLIEFKVFKPDLPRDMDVLDQACADKVADYIFNTNNFTKTFKVWLFLEVGAWLKKSSVVLQGGLRALREKAWLDQLPKMHEVIIESGNRSKSAGLAEIVTREHFMAAIKLSRSHHWSCVIASERADITSEKSINSIFASAFPPGNKILGVNWSHLSLSLCPIGDILLRVSGSYDERLATIDCIMAPERAVLFKK